MFCIRCYCLRYNVLYQSVNFKRYTSFISVGYVGDKNINTVSVMLDCDVRWLVVGTLDYGS